MPNVTGLPVRDAVRQLHASGYRVQVQGSGVVNAIAGLSGNVVRLRAVEVTR
jgi:hypothetical protein